MHITGSIDEAVKTLVDEDLSGVDEDDLAQLFFAMGPAAITELISKHLESLTTDEAVEQLAALTTIRHSILASYQSVSS